MLRLAVEPQDAPVEHRDDEELAFRGPSQPGRTLRDLDDGLIAAIETDGRHAVRVEIGEPELAVVPARRLAELQAVEQDLELRAACHRTNSSQRVETNAARR